MILNVKNLGYGKLLIGITTQLPIQTTNPPTLNPPIIGKQTALIKDNLAHLQFPNQFLILF
jgi:hypothetical protein